MNAKSISLAVTLICASIPNVRAQESLSCRGAELIVRNANIVTMGTAPARAEAMAVRNGRIVAVGTSAEVSPCADAASRIVDLQKKMVLPGLIDVHSHVMSWAIRHVQGVMDLRYPGTHSIQEVKELVRQRAAALKPGEWIYGNSWDDAMFAEKRYITRKDLDEVAPVNPVHLEHVSGHLCALNSAALKLAGITKDTKEPQGGVIEHDDSGEPTGVLKDTAQELARVPEPPGTPDTTLQAAKLVSDYAASLGITTLHDVGAADWSAYQRADQQGDLKIRVLILPIVSSVAGAEQLARWGLHTGFGDEHLKLGAAKFFADGGMGARTIAIYPPSVAGETNNFGLLIWKSEDLEKAQELLARAGWQLTTHAVGDRAMDQVLDSYAGVMKKLRLSEPRFRIVHAGISTPAIQKRLKELHVLVDGDPPFVYWIGSWFEKYGAQRVRWSYPGRSYIENGIIAGGGSDFGVTPLNPFWGIMAAVSRKEILSGKVLAPEERLNVQEALGLYTRNGSYIGFEENHKGSLEPGKLADFIVIDRDIFSIPPDEISQTRVLQTFVGGRKVFDASQ